MKFTVTFVCCMQFKIMTRIRCSAYIRSTQYAVYTYHICEFYFRCVCALTSSNSIAQMCLDVLWIPKKNPMAQNTEYMNNFISRKISFAHLNPSKNLKREKMTVRTSYSILFVHYPLFTVHRHIKTLILIYNSFMASQRMGLIALGDLLF